MSKYFDFFPTVQYNPAGTPYKNRTVLTDITFRFKLRDKVKSNIFSYYTVSVSDDDTMEILAAKYYGNSEYHWVIAIANDIIDPQYDWPMSYRTYVKYIAAKYGSAAQAELTVHHYEKVITRFNQRTRVTEELIMEVQKPTYDDLPETAFRQFDLEDGTTIEETIIKRTISASQFEFDQNNKKKQMRIIKKEYLPEILDEFREMMGL